jgi:hypothetical protein
MLPFKYSCTAEDGCGVLGRETLNSFTCKDPTTLGDERNKIKISKVQNPYTESMHLKNTPLGISIFKRSKGYYKTRKESHAKNISITRDSSESCDILMGGGLSILKDIPCSIPKYFKREIDLYCRESMDVECRESEFMDSLESKVMVVDGTDVPSTISSLSSDTAGIWMGSNSSMSVLSLSMGRNTCASSSCSVFCGKFDVSKSKKDKKGTDGEITIESGNEEVDLFAKHIQDRFYSSLNTDVLNGNRMIQKACLLIACKVIGQDSFEDFESDRSIFEEILLVEDKGFSAVHDGMIGSGSIRDVLLYSESLVLDTLGFSLDIAGF